MGLGLDGPVSEAKFEQCEAFYRRRGTQPAFSLCPLADPTLLEHLNHRGYQVEMFMHVWYRPLAAGETFPPPPSGIVVRAIEPEEADLWTLVAFRGGLDSDEALPKVGVIIAPYPFMAQARCWLATAATVSSLFVALNEISGISPLRSITWNSICSSPSFSAPPTTASSWARARTYG